MKICFYFASIALAKICNANILDMDLFDIRDFVRFSVFRCICYVSVFTPRMSLLPSTSKRFKSPIVMMLFDLRQLTPLLMQYIHLSLPQNQLHIFLGHGKNHHHFAFPVLPHQYQRSFRSRHQHQNCRDMRFESASQLVKLIGRTTATVPMKRMVNCLQHSGTSSTQNAMEPVKVQLILFPVVFTQIAIVHLLQGFLYMKLEIAPMTIFRLPPLQRIGVFCLTKNHVWAVLA